jgi:hypothetical protein
MGGSICVREENIAISASRILGLVIRTFAGGSLVTTFRSESITIRRRCNIPGGVAIKGRREVCNSLHIDKLAGRE